MNNEFKKVKNNSETRYVLETATAGATSSSVVATAPGKKRADSILAQEGDKKKEAPKPRNFVAKNAKMGGAGKMKDKAKTIPRKEKHKKAIAEGFNGEYDDEAGMAHSNLLTTARAVMGLLKTIKDKDNLPEWGQEKIAKAEMMLVSVWDYLQSQKQMGNDPQQDVAESEQSVSEGAEQMTPNWAKYVLDQIYNSNGTVTLTDLFDEGIPGLHDMFMDTAKQHGLDPEEDFEDVQHELTVELEDLIKGGGDQDAEEGYNPNSVSAQHRREIQSHHEAEIRRKAETGDADAVKRLELMLKHKERRANDYDARMEREGVEVNNSKSGIAQGMAGRYEPRTPPGHYDDMFDPKNSHIRPGPPTRGVDKNGRTQSQWLALVKKKFPDAKVMVAKMMDGPAHAMLPDGRKLSWIKVEQPGAKPTQQSRWQVADKVGEAKGKWDPFSGGDFGQDPHPGQNDGDASPDKQKEKDKWEAMLDYYGTNALVARALGDLYQQTHGSGYYDNISGPIRYVATISSRSTPDSKERVETVSVKSKQEAHEKARGKLNGRVVSIEKVDNKEDESELITLPVMLGLGAQRKKWMLKFPDERYAQKWEFKHKNVAQIIWPGEHELSKPEDTYMESLSTSLTSVLQEKAPPGDKYERMVKHIKKGYSKDGKLTDVEKSKAYGAAWKAKNKTKK